MLLGRQWTANNRAKLGVPLNKAARAFRRLMAAMSWRGEGRGGSSAMANQITAAALRQAPEMITFD